MGIAENISLRKQLIFTCVIVLCLLSIGEVTVRIWAYWFRTSYERYNPNLGRFELVPNTRYKTKGGKEFVINSKGLLGPEFDSIPQDRTYRIIALGDSCTFGSGNWAETYPAILQQRLNSGGSRTKFEVLNAGIEGYNSQFALGRLKDELLNYKPKLVIIYIGWNDLMKVDPANASATEQYALLANLFEKSYLMKAYKKLLFVHLRPLLFQPKVGDAEQDSHAYETYTPYTYQANLESMISLLKRNSIQIILLTRPTVVRRGMSLEDIKKNNVFFPHYAGSFSVGRFLSLHKAFNSVVLRLGKGHNVPVLDLDEIFNRAPDKSPLFWDTMHPSEKGTQLIATSLYEKIKQLQSHL